MEIPALDDECHLHDRYDDVSPVLLTNPDYSYLNNREPAVHRPGPLQPLVCHHEQANDSLSEKLQELVASPETVTYFRKKAPSRIEQYYNWEWLTDFYEDLFIRMVAKKNLISYDEFLGTKTMRLFHTHEEKSKIRDELF